MIAQDVVNVEDKWCKSHDIPRSVDNSFVLHCKSNNHRQQYIGDDSPSPSRFKDLEVLCAQQRLCWDKTSN